MLEFFHLIRLRFFLIIEKLGKTPDYYRVHFLAIPNEILRPDGRISFASGMSSSTSPISASNKSLQ